MQAAIEVLMPAAAYDQRIEEIKKSINAIKERKERGDDLGRPWFGMTYDEEKRQQVPGERWGDVVEIFEMREDGYTYERITDTVGYRHVTDFDTPGCRKSSRSYSQQYQAALCSGQTSVLTSNSDSLATLRLDMCGTGTPTPATTHEKRHEHTTDPKAKLLRTVLLGMSESTRVTERGQATIPKDLRDKYDLEPGDEVVWIDTDEGIVVKKRTRTGGRGMLVPEGTPEEKRNEIAEELEQRVRNRRDHNYEEA